MSRAFTSPSLSFLPVSTILIALLTPLLHAQDPVQPRQAPRINPMPVPKVVVLKRGDRNIVIDGDVQDWPSLPPLMLEDYRQLSGTAIGAYRGSDDFSAIGFLLWDDDYFYFCAQVRDDWPLRLVQGIQVLSEVPPADSLLLSFDPRRDTRSIGRDAGREEDRDFWLAETDEEQGKKVVAWDRLRGSAQFAKGATGVVTHDKKTGRTVYEVKIPWKIILPPGDRAVARKIVDLQVVISDFDDPTDVLPQTRIGWTFGMGTRIDPGLFGSIMLMEQSADESGGKVSRPDFPPPATLDGDPVPGKRFWLRFLERLKATEPGVFSVNTPDARMIGGSERRDLLAQLDYQNEIFPRVDLVELQNRIHRRMNREVLGQLQTGLPFFWDQCLEDLSERVGDAPPKQGFRLFRLPQGGWLVRSSKANFAIDPAGYGIEKRLWGAIDFVLLTRPLDTSKRNDQLLVRMTANKPKRPVLIHLTQHLPGFEAKDLPIVQVGQSYNLLGLEIKPIGYQDEKGMVTASIGFHVEWPDSTKLVVSGISLLEELVPGPGDIDLLLLSAQHPAARVVGQRLRARLTVLDDVLQPTAAPPPLGRVSLDKAYELQRGLRPYSSLILAPGEHWDVMPAAK